MDKLPDGRGREETSIVVFRFEKLQGVLKMQAIDGDAAQMLKTKVQVYEKGETLHGAVRQFFECRKERGETVTAFSHRLHELWDLIRVEQGAQETQIVS